jgi:hypothetical protein
MNLPAIVTVTITMPLFAVLIGVRPAPAGPLRPALAVYRGLGDFTGPGLFPRHRRAS